MTEPAGLRAGVERAGWRVCQCSPATDHAATTVSSLPVTRNDPSSANATAVTACAWGEIEGAFAGAGGGKNAAVAQGGLAAAGRRGASGADGEPPNAERCLPCGGRARRAGGAPRRSPRGRRRRRRCRRSRGRRPGRRRGRRGARRGSSGGRGAPCPSARSGGRPCRVALEGREWRRGRMMSVRRRRTRAVGSQAQSPGPGGGGAPATKWSAPRRQMPARPEEFPLKAATWDPLLTSLRVRLRENGDGTRLGDPRRV